MEWKTRHGGPLEGPALEAGKPHLLMPAAKHAIPSYPHNPAGQKSARGSGLPTRRAPSALRLEHSPLLLFCNSISSYKRTTIERNGDEPLESSGLGDICVAVRRLRYGILRS